MVLQSLAPSIERVAATPPIFPKSFGLMFAVDVHPFRRGTGEHSCEKTFLSKFQLPHYCVQSPTCERLTA